MLKTKSQMQRFKRQVKRTFTIYGKCTKCGKIYFIGREKKTKYLYKKHLFDKLYFVKLPCFDCLSQNLPKDYQIDFDLRKTIFNLNTIF